MLVRGSSSPYPWGENPVLVSVFWLFEDKNPLEIDTVHDTWVDWLYSIVDKQMI